MQFGQWLNVITLSGSDRVGSAAIKVEKPPWNLRKETALPLNDSWPLAQLSPGR